MSIATPRFLASPATAQALAESRAVAILIGSYDGSGNFGDLAQLDANLRLLAPLQPGLLVAPVIERAYLHQHEELRQHFLNPPAHVIVFDPEGAGGEGLLPLAAPASLGFAAIHLYGGGYLNSLWGERKLAMLRDAEALLGASAEQSRIARVSSGLQVEPDWVERLDPEDTKALAAFETLGPRDHRSGQALAHLNPEATVPAPSDDATSVIPAPAGAAAGRGGPTGELRLNVHFAHHDWVTAQPQAALAAIVELAAKLGRRTERPVAVQPLIAYLDQRIDERADLELLREACATHGMAVDEAEVLRPAGLAVSAASLEQAELTISCSYHVALTSLLLGVPTAILGDNAYYEQKAAGLTDAFGPALFSFAVDGDSAELAARLAAALGPDRASFRAELASRGRDLREHRAEAERLLLARLGGEALSALAAQLDELEGRLRLRSAEPAELQARIAALHSENEALRQPAVEAAIAAADERAQRAGAEAEAAHRRLAEVFESRSWKLAQPLRRAGAAVRRNPPK